MERSVDLKDFKSVGEVTGFGNSSSLISYEYLDEEISSYSTRYYRVKQVDFDGDVDYSKVISSSCLSDQKLYMIYPTVSDGEFTIQLDSEVSKFSVDVYNSLGNNVFSEQLIDQFESYYTFNVDSPLSGIYLVKVRTNDIVRYTKIIKR